MNFPENTRASETALLFMQFIMRSLKRGGRSGVVVPNGFMFGDGVAARVNEAQRLREEVDESIGAFIASYHVHYSEKVVKLGDVLVLDEDKEIIKPEGSYPQIGVKGFGKGLFARETLSGTQTTYKWLIIFIMVQLY